MKISFIILYFVYNIQHEIEDKFYITAFFRPIIWPLIYVNTFYLRRIHKGLGIILNHTFEAPNTNFDIICYFGARLIQLQRRCRLVNKQQNIRDNHYKL